jgi:hypothetical protein
VDLCGEAASVSDHLSLIRPCQDQAETCLSLSRERGAFATSFHRERSMSRERSNRNEFPHPSMLPAVHDRVLCGGELGCGASGIRFPHLP